MHDAHTPTRTAVVSHRCVARYAANLELRGETRAVRCHKRGQTCADVGLRRSVMHRPGSQAHAKHACTRCALMRDSCRRQHGPRGAGAPCSPGATLLAPSCKFWVALRRTDSQLGATRHKSEEINGSQQINRSQQSDRSRQSDRSQQINRS